jgi:hypothetical protein
MTRPLRRGMAVRFLLCFCPCVALMACGGPAPAPGGRTSAPTTVSSPTPNAGADPCLLMSATEASAIAGTALVAEGSQPRAALRECVFVGGTASLFVDLQQSSDPAALMATFEGFESQLASGASPYTITQVPSLGSLAFTARTVINDSTAAGIYVVDGSSFFDVVCVTTPGCDAQSLMAGEAFAASRLPVAAG